MAPVHDRHGVHVGTIEQPLDTLVWADGGTLSGVQPFSLRMYQMHRALQRDDAPPEEILALLRLTVPDGATWTTADGRQGAVDEDYRLDMPGPRVFLAFEHAQYKLKQAVEAMEEARKNAPGAAADLPAPPSAPTMNTSTPSPASGASRAGTGSPSRTRRSTASSTPSIG